MRNFDMWRRRQRSRTRSAKPGKSSTSSPPSPRNGAASPASGTSSAPSPSSPASPASPVMTPRASTSSPPVSPGSSIPSPKPSSTATFTTGFVLTVILFGLLVYVTLWMKKAHETFDDPHFTKQKACDVVTPEQLVVPTSSGTVYGETATLVDASDNTTRGVLRRFFGIPYGLPPRGTSRFRMARASSYFPNGGTWNATSHGPPCPQNGPHYEDSAEDCLTMSIWAPFVCSEREPLKTVLVAVSGEWLQTGDVRDHEVFWQDLAHLGDVIVVSVNYRLGIMGFFNGEPSDAPGNVGIYDAFMALVWVRNNAAAFHGNSSLMVAVGHGSGAYVFSLDLLANLTTRRFFRRLLLHGLSINSMFPRNDESSGVSLMQRAVSCRVEEHSAIAMTKCLRSKSHKELLDAVNATLPLRFVPSRYRPPLELVSQTDLWTHLASLADVDIVIGYSVQEGNALFDDYLVPSLKFNASTPTSVVYEKSARFYTDVGVHVYSSLSAGTKGFLERPNFQGFRDFLTHFTMTCPSTSLAAAASAKGATVYHYASLGPHNLFEPVFSPGEIITFAKTGKVKWKPFSANQTTLTVDANNRRREEERWQFLTCIAVKGIMAN
ncbi:hypothetical protein HPB50_024548 [Hyalomma asiaticum]|uniref:Uncharacterized protein n=1 Tax=Hyalomma asiaticum TaxID=266040 RepID=A0ACB7SKI9_HYAAI|nr:hypothetical protein HPB50_024548 [Hyalomma asiaticum]